MAEDPCHGNGIPSSKPFEGPLKTFETLVSKKDSQHFWIEMGARHIYCTYYIHVIIYIIDIDIYTYTVTELRYRLSPLIVAQGVCSWHDPWHGLEVSSLGQETLQQHLRVSFCMMFFFGLF